MLETGNHFLSLIMVHVSQTELILPVPVFILEDDAIMQQRLKRILLEIGYAEDALIFAQTLSQAIDMLQEYPISFSLVDLGLPDGNGIDFIENLRQSDEVSPILVISAWSTQETILKAIQAGATGYLLKERDDFEIMLSIRSILRGGAPIDPFIAQQILSKITFEQKVKDVAVAEQNNLLSTREFEILQLVAQGMSNREIADFLHILEAKNELTLSLNTQHQLELDNAKLQERLQLAHDLHDGLGGSLVRSMVTVDQSQINLSNQQFLSMLKILRDDLRQVIDSGSSTGAKVPDTPILWGAPLRHRFTQLFDELDITTKWSFPESWQKQPTPLVCLTLLRVAEEALTNILKHSQATSVKCALFFSKGQLVLDIEDNGIGFDVEAVQNAGMSVGLRSMQTRLERLGGHLTVQSEAGRTCLKACLPV